jgi:hypothetical protein
LQHAAQKGANSKRNVTEKLVALTKISKNERSTAAKLPPHTRVIQRKQPRKAILSVHDFAFNEIFFLESASKTDFQSEPRGKQNKISAERTILSINLNQNAKTPENIPEKCLSLLRTLETFYFFKNFKIVFIAVIKAEPFNII